MNDLGQKFSRIAVSKRPGMILYIVAVVLAMLAFAVFALSVLLATDHEAAVLRGEELVVTQIAQSGIAYTAALIQSTEAAKSETEAGEEAFSDVSSAVQDDGAEEAFAEIGPATFSSASNHIDPFHPSGPFGGLPANETVTSSDLYDNVDRFAGVPVVLPQSNRPRRGAGRFTVLAPRFEEDRLVGIRYGLVNESARLHLGTVLRWEEETPGQGVRSLMTFPGMTPSSADSILDWIDPDKTPRGSGAEIDYYRRAGLHYAPRNTVPVSLEELLLVRDVTRSLLFGDDETFSFGYRPSGNRRSVSGTLPWGYLLTTLSAEKLVDPQTGRGKIDLNGNDLEFLFESIRDRVDLQAAEFIIRYRQTGPDKAASEEQKKQIASQEGPNTEKAKENDSGEPDRKGPDWSRPAKHRLATPLDLLDITVEEHTSPFALDGTEREERFFHLLDAATEYRELVLPGRININEAPRCVLEAIPGMTDDIVSKIMAARTPPGESRRPRERHACWILAENIVDKATMHRLWPNITTGGDVWRGQIVGFFDGEGPINRIEIVLDGTVKPPRRVYTKELSLHGIGYPKSLLSGQRE